MLSPTKKGLLLLSLLITLTSFGAEKKENKYLQLYKDLMNQPMPNTIKTMPYDNNELMEKTNKLIADMKNKKTSPEKILKWLLVMDPNDFASLYSPRNVIICADLSKPGTGSGYVYLYEMLKKLDEINKPPLTGTQRGYIAKNLATLEKNIAEAKLILEEGPGALPLPRNLGEPGTAITPEMLRGARGQFSHVRSIAHAPEAPAQPTVKRGGQRGAAITPEMLEQERGRLTQIPKPVVEEHETIDLPMPPKPVVEEHETIDLPMPIPTSNEASLKEIVSNIEGMNDSQRILNLYKQFDPTIQQQVYPLLSHEKQVILRPLQSPYTRVANNLEKITNYNQIQELYKKMSKETKQQVYPLLSPAKQAIVRDLYEREFGPQPNTTSTSTSTTAKQLIQPTKPAMIEEAAIQAAIKHEEESFVKETMDELRRDDPETRSLIYNRLPPVAKNLLNTAYEKEFGPQPHATSTSTSTNPTKTKKPEGPENYEWDEKLGQWYYINKEGNKVFTFK